MESFEGAPKICEIILQAASSRHCPHVVDTRFVTLLYNMQDVSIQNQEMLDVHRLDRVNVNTHAIIKQCLLCTVLIATAQQQTGRSYLVNHIHGLFEKYI
jgi:hypothetical protein